MGKQNYKVTMVDGNTYYLYQTKIEETRVGCGYNLLFTTKHTENLSGKTVPNILIPI